MSAVEDYEYLEFIEADGKALLNIAADSDLTLPIPACPGWTLRELVEHVAGANKWVSHCVSSGLAAQDRVLPPGPRDRKALLMWARQSCDELLEVLSASPPDQLVWTPIRGPQVSVWWRRKAAVEVAIHRTDAETALGWVPVTIDAPLALDGIDEYAEEFLPLMLARVSASPVSEVLLSPDDSDECRTLSLTPAVAQTDSEASSVELKASASNLLLWMWNRVPEGTLEVSGDDAVVEWWKRLSI